MVLWVVWPTEFGVEVAGVVRRLERKPKSFMVTHLREIPIPESTDTAGGGGVGRGHSLVYVEVVVVLRFIVRTPTGCARMVPVAADHSADVVDRDLFPRFVADMLPAGNFFENEQPISSQASKEVAGLRVV